jgi:AraC-like DNA-binding protein
MEQAEPAAPTRPQPARLEFCRSVSVPDVELVDVFNTSQGWQCFATAYELVVPFTWSADLAANGRQLRVDTQQAYCAKPGDLFLTTGIHQIGDASVLCIPDAMMAEFVAERGFGDVPGCVPELMQNDATLRERIRTLGRLLRDESDPLHCQWTLFQILETLVGPNRATLSARAASRLRQEDAATAARVREWLDSKTSGRVDLYALAEETGRSRYQVLRAFKRRYGLPPHAYHLCVRIAQAQRLLASGQSPAQVAVASGFVDQSHFSKHFRRVVGVTPAQYARRSNGRARPLTDVGSGDWADSAV